jgi:hypothetical protein
MSEYLWQLTHRNIPGPTALNTVEPGYNDIILYDTSSITSEILWYQLIPHC